MDSKRKKILSVILGSVFLLGGAKALKGYSTSSGQNYETSDALLYKNYSVNCDSLNVRFSKSEKAPILSQLNFGDVVTVIDEDDTWALVYDGENVGYVAKKYLIETVNSTNYEDSIFADKDILIVNAENGLNLRKEANAVCDVITCLPNKTELTCIAAVNCEWYLVKYNGTLGYVHKDYVLSVKDMVKNYYSDAEKVEIAAIAYPEEDAVMYYDLNNQAENFDIINEYQSVKILDEDSNYYFVLYNGKVGYVQKEYLKKLNGIFVVIDLSDQELICYCNVDEIQNNKVTTGRKGMETPQGIYAIEYKQKNRYLSRYDTTVNYWMQYNGNYGMHDMKQSRPFGGDTYVNHGSHGCVRMSLDSAERLYNTVSKGDKVLIKK